MKRFLKPTSYRTSAIVSTTLVLTGCTVLTYRGPNGEQFTRASLGSNTAIGSLAVESDTNGLRRVEMRGYTNNATEALSTVTEAAVRAAIQAPK